MRKSTLLFLIKKDGNTITDICLAMKKRGFGKGRYNGVGGKVERDETVEEAVRREAKEEIGISVLEMSQCATLAFTFPHNPDWSQEVHVYFSTKLEGEPVESEEMNPSWFIVERIPYETMWPDDSYWLPKVLEGGKVKGKFTFGEGDSILEHEVITS